MWYTTRMKHDVPKINGLMQKRLSWYLRVRVPSDLMQHYGKKEVIRSLKTRDYNEARKILPVHRTSIEAEFDQLRHKIKAEIEQPDMLSLYSEYELERIAIDWFREQEHKKESKAETLGTLTQKDLDDALIDLEISAQEYDDEIQGISTKPEHHGLTYAWHYLDKRGITFDPKSKNFSRLGHLISRASGESVKQNIRKIKNKPYAPIDKLFLNTGSAHLHNPALKKKTLSELCKEYVNDPTSQRNKGSEKNFAIIFRVLNELIGENRQVSEITQDDCKKVRDVLCSLPANAAKKAKGKTLVEASELAKKYGWAKLSVPTINNYLGTLHALLGYAKKQKCIVENPADDLKIKIKKKSKRRYPFDAEQLHKIFNAPLYTGCQNDGHGCHKAGSHIIKGTRFWIPLIALYTGMRLNEICQLEVDDFVKEGGIYFIHVREDSMEEESDKKLKSVASVRMIPIHPELKKIGLIAYVEDKKQKKAIRLWADLKKDRFGYYSDLFSKWFANFVKNAAAKKPKTSFHSFRHNFRTAMGNAGLPYDVVLSFGGWTTGSVEGKYKDQLLPSVLYDWMCKISYPKLDLSHLYEESAKDGQSCNL